MKAIGLIRVSTQSQKLESQSLKVKEAILRDGFSEDDIILIEDTESGSKLSEEERSGLNKLKYHVEHEQVSSVYCYELSRISRKSTIVFSIRDYLTSRKINLICLNPYFRMLRQDGSFDENSNLFFGIFSSMAENETYIRTRRIMRGKEKKKSEGKLSCVKPYFGYDVDENHYIIPHRENSKIVQEIFTRYSNLESSSSIGRDLYYRGILCNKNSKMVTVQTYTCNILRDKRYAKIDPDSIYPPLISKELFYKCEEIRKNKPDYFIRKSKTKGVYPLQGYIFTDEGYMMSPSITNNRYLKMTGGGVTRVSLNMKAADELTRRIMTDYINGYSGNLDREREYKENTNILQINKLKIENIDIKIKSIQEENERINERIIKGRMSSERGDSMIDDNMLSIHSLEDTRQELIYQNSIIENKINYLSNPLFNTQEVITCNTNEELKELVIRYLKKVVVHKLGFSRYKLEYFFLDGTYKSGCFYSVNKLLEFYDIK